VRIERERTGRRESREEEDKRKKERKKRKRKGKGRRVCVHVAKICRSMVHV
jgi:hypothetical protein